MKITRIEDIHGDGGWRTLSYLKIVTDEGLVGWSEFGESRSSPGLAAVIRQLGERVIGADPTQVNRVFADLKASTRIFSGGLLAQAIAAIENACWDIKGKWLGVPVYELLGGAFRRRLPLYWSQCGTLRTQHAGVLGTAPLNSLDDVVSLGREVRERGYRALKTNMLMFDGGVPSNCRPGFGFGDEHPSVNVDERVVGGLVDLLHAFRQGAGPQVRLMLDLNFNCRPEGARRIARALEPFDLLWLELDMVDPRALAEVRRATSTPIASLEAVFGRQAMRPFLDDYAVDVAIIDPQWNGLSESVRMANLAEAYEVNVAAHNYHGHLSSLIGAHFCASIPNFRISELVVDESDWTRDFLVNPLQVENGELVVPSAPGWGSDINEDAVRSRPPRRS